MKKISVLIAAALVLAGCSTTENTFENAVCDGVEVKVNYGILTGDPVNECITFDGEQILALDALNQAGVVTEGTVTYPDAIVCRVNGLPAEDVAIEVEGEDPHFESCADMPPAFAYWALWVINDESVGWEYAMEGASTLLLNKGQSIGLAFASGTEAPTPDN